MKPEYQKQNCSKNLVPQPRDYILGYMLLIYSLAYPTIPKVERSNTHAILANNPSSLVIVHLRHRLALLRILLWCGWQQVMEIENLLEEVGACFR
jgi:hypothetical protein